MMNPLCMVTGRKLRHKAARRRNNRAFHRSYPTRHLAVETLEVRAMLSISNPGFDTGDLSSWTPMIPPGGSAGAVSSHVAVPADGTTFAPVDGSHFALLKTDGPGSFTTLSQSFLADAGDEISGSAFFDSAESNLSFNDSAQVRILSGSTVVETVFDEDVVSVGGNGQTPWTAWSHTFNSAGTFTIEARVTNDGDSIIDSFMGLDALTFSGDPPHPPDHWRSI